MVGPQGELGARGPPGKQGPMGFQGEQGLPGIAGKSGVPVSVCFFSYFAFYKIGQTCKSLIDLSILLSFRFIYIFCACVSG